MMNGCSRFSGTHTNRPAISRSPSDNSAGAATATNYQVLPGDRVFIAENKLIAIDALVSRITAPVERLFGTTLLSTQTIQTINRFPLGLSGSGGQGF